jgi:CRP/FNR family transcriptional regulator, cyclic AMP receptor protein
MPDRVNAAAESPDWLADARRRGLLSRLPEGLVSSLIQGAQRVGCPAGAVIPGWEEVPWAVVVLHGCLRVFLPSPDGSQITIRYMRAGDTIGTFLGRGAGLARSLQAIEGSELLHLDISRLTSLAKSEPVLAWEMLLETTRALQLSHRAYSIRAFGSVRLRVANALVERATTCGGGLQGAVIAGTQHDLANAAGTVREVVASALHELKREGILEVRRGRIVILDPERLLREADGGLGIGPIS